ncbi:unnamed protein product [Gongylonema pulchrum]|uniref:FERM domain-containing protein n=1 Tax=Gongylonema pulchrum TaxID=637853 RepID=A0A183DNH1_9BILA|nr:unnamed protein product [Gongylonema pulchrum]
MKGFGKPETSGDPVLEAVGSNNGYHKRKANWDLRFIRCFSCRLRLYLVKESGSCEEEYENFNCHGLLHDVDRPVMLMLLIRSPTCLHEQFQITITPKGKIIRCGFRLPSILKRLPQDLVGCCYYDLVHEGDLLDVSQHHKQGLFFQLKQFTSYLLQQMNNFLRNGDPPQFLLID